MKRKILLPFILLTIFCCNGYAYTLDSTYNYRTSTIYSTDVVPDCPKKFELLKIPEGKTTYRLNAQILVKSFELNGCIIDTVKSPFINFTKESGIDIGSLRTQINDLFLLHYSTIQIHQINIHPRGYIDNLPSDIKAIFDTNTHERSEGTFYVMDNNAVRRYFDFSLHADIPILHSNQKITRNEVLSSANARMVTVPFTTFKSQPLIAFPEISHRLRVTLKENSPILKRNIEPLPIVTKGGRVVVVVKNGSVQLEFSATAMQEGSLYDIISIQKSDGKRSKAKIIGENRVELQ